MYLSQITSDMIWKPNILRYQNRRLIFNYRLWHIDWVWICMVGDAFVEYFFPFYSSGFAPLEVLCLCITLICLLIWFVKLENRYMLYYNSSFHFDFFLTYINNQGLIIDISLNRKHISLTSLWWLEKCCIYQLSLSFELASITASILKKLLFSLGIFFFLLTV